MWSFTRCPIFSLVSSGVRSRRRGLCDPHSRMTSPLVCILLWRGVLYLDRSATWSVNYKLSNFSFTKEDHLFPIKNRHPAVCSLAKGIELAWEYIQFFHLFGGQTGNVIDQVIFLRKFIRGNIDKISMIALSWIYLQKAVWISSGSGRSILSSAHLWLDPSTSHRNPSAPLTIWMIHVSLCSWWNLNLPLL